jgi:hypothetical protein
MHACMQYAVNVPATFVTKLASTKRLAVLRSKCLIGGGAS